MNYAVGAVVTLLGLLGLFLASRSHDGAMYLFGLLLFAFAILFTFYLIHRSGEKAH